MKMAGIKDTITQGELEMFFADGLVTIETPFSDPRLSAARQAVRDQFERGEGVSGTWIGGSVCDETLVSILADPFFETLAQKVLRTNDVILATFGIRRTFSSPNATFKYEDEHVDFRCTREDLAATPARFLCGGALWLTDVTSENNPMYYRPRSHLLIARHTEEHPEADTGRTHQTPPDLTYEDYVPVLAKAGQYSLFGTPLVHRGSVTRGPNKERIAFFIEYKARDAEFNFYVDEQDAMWDTIRKLRDHVPKARRHVLPD